MKLLNSSMVVGIGINETWLSGFIACSCGQSQCLKSWNFVDNWILRVKKEKFKEMVGVYCYTIYIGRERAKPLACAYHSHKKWESFTFCFLSCCLLPWFMEGMKQWLMVNRAG